MFTRFRVHSWQATSQQYDNHVDNEAGVSMPLPASIAERSTPPGHLNAESALVARWRSGEFCGPWLRTEDGVDLRVLFAGRAGGPAGPDFRDAVLERRDGDRICGDVELHTRAHNWRLHGHQRDPRYNNVVLHVVQHAEGSRITTLASGKSAPIVALTSRADSQSSSAPLPVRTWPCADLARHRSASQMRALLATAGEARFSEHMRMFAVAWDREEIASQAASLASASPLWTAIDRVLLVALAEGLAYGREREPLRRAGEWLAAGGAPDALVRDLPCLGRVDAQRLEGLLIWFARWKVTGPWTVVRAALSVPPERAAIVALERALMVPSGPVSHGRAAILAINVALPVAALWAKRQHDHALAERARTLYARYPGLPSNQITREMARQLGLRRQPSGARAQQGLQHLWVGHCRVKVCERCPCAATLDA